MSTDQAATTTVDLLAAMDRISDVSRTALRIAQGGLDPARRAEFFTRKAELLDDMGLCDLAVVARQKAAS